jgi:hypothetical protein
LANPVLCQEGLPVRQKSLPFRLPETQTASRRAPGSAENPRQHVNIRGRLLHQAACFCPKKPLCQKGWPRLSESLAVRNNIQGIFAPKNARNMPPFSRQRFMANLCPTAHLSGNALLRCDTTHKAKNSFNALYKNELDGENLSSDLRQTFVASTANLPDKAHGQLGECFYTLPITVYLKMKFKVEISTVRAKITSASSVILIFLG